MPLSLHLFKEIVTHLTKRRRVMRGKLGILNEFSTLFPDSVLISEPALICDT
jgi:hypothetical protein